MERSLESGSTAHSGQPRETNQEAHSSHGDVVRDIILGFADGLTVPFALTAGLSSYVSSHLLFVLAWARTQS
jgi:vacuolar iron transporter family protein